MRLLNRRFQAFRAGATGIVFIGGNAVGREVGAFGHRRVRHGYDQTGRGERPWRVDISRGHDLGRQMACPAGAVPAVELAAGLPVIENHPRRIAIDQVVQAIKRVIVLVAEVYHHDLGPAFHQQIPAEAGHTAFVDDPRAMRLQRKTQLAAQFAIVEKQCDPRTGFSHGPAPTHAAPGPRRWSQRARWSSSRYDRPAARPRPHRA